MRVFLAGASGVIGLRLLPLLVAAGHQVAAMTRTPVKTAQLRALGAEPVVCDVFDLDALRHAVATFAPHVVVHQLTDLPEDKTRLVELSAANDRMRREGTRNLLTAAKAAGSRIVAQSIAWPLPADRQTAVDDHERGILDAAGVVIRYGQFYGPGTCYEHDLPSPPRIHIDTASRRTVPLLDAPTGVIVIVDDQPKPAEAP
ncbi:MAG: epimerase [Pseudonocardiales bacterium]|nr:MAG: epimerase [Pseudonocardiales bacterium]